MNRMGEEKRIEILGQGLDNEKIELEQVHAACWLVHCRGNSQSPFEFSSEKDARQYKLMKFLYLH
jgi:hypothetical protein